MNSSISNSLARSLTLWIHHNLKWFTSTCSCLVFLFFLFSLASFVVWKQWEVFYSIVLLQEILNQCIIANRKPVHTLSTYTLHTTHMIPILLFSHIVWQVFFFSLSSVFFIEPSTFCYLWWVFMCACVMLAAHAAT